MNQSTSLKLKIAVLFGGISLERDVSIASARTVMQALRTKGHDAYLFDSENGLLSEDKEKELLSYHVGQAPPNQHQSSKKTGYKTNLLTFIDALKAFDLIFIALHGSFGEDGHIQALFDLANIPYTGSNVTSSALAMHKHFSKRLVQSAGVITPDWRLITEGSYQGLNIHQFPVIVKPNTQGSSIGVNVAYDQEQFEEMVRQTFYYDEELLIESYIKGREITIGVLGDQALMPGEIKTDEDSFSYYHKYQPNSVTETFPAELDTTTIIYIQTAALTAHHALGLSDYSRIDFILDEKEQLWFLEANSLPGLTSTSLYPQSAKASDIELGCALEEICFNALGRYRRKR